MLTNVIRNVEFYNVNVTFMNVKCSTMDIIVTIQKSSQLFSIQKSSQKNFLDFE